MDRFEVVLELLSLLFLIVLLVLLHDLSFSDLSGLVLYASLFPLNLGIFDTRLSSTWVLRFGPNIDWNIGAIPSLQSIILRGSGHVGVQVDWRHNCGWLLCLMDVAHVSGNTVASLLAGVHLVPLRSEQSSFIALSVSLWSIHAWIFLTILWIHPLVLILIHWRNCSIEILRGHVAVSMSDNWPVLQFIQWLIASLEFRQLLRRWLILIHSIFQSWSNSS